MNRGGFSWNRLLGISTFKSNISRQIGIPLTRSGRQRKLGAFAGTFIGFIIIFCLTSFLVFLGILLNFLSVLFGIANQWLTNQYRRLKK